MTYNISTSADCEKCPLGTFNGLLGQNNPQACIPCPKGFFSALSGAFNCAPCPENTFLSDIGQSQCLPCKSGVRCLMAATVEDNTNTTATIIADSDTASAIIRGRAEDIGSSIAQSVIAIVFLLSVVLTFCTIPFFLICLSKKAKLSSKFKYVFSYFDFFSMNHFVVEKASVVNTPKWNGGIMTAIFVVSFMTILVLVLLDVTKSDNIIQTTSVVPVTNIRNATIEGYFRLDVMLYNFGTATCAGVIVPSGWNGVKNESFAVVNNTCTATFECSACQLTGTSQQVAFDFPHSFAMATAISYKFTFPYYDTQQGNSSITYYTTPTNTSQVLRGDIATDFPISMTVTEYSQISGADYFFYHIGTRLNPSLKRNTLGFTVVPSKPQLGSVADSGTFWRAQGVKVRISLVPNPNAYFINQIGRATILDMLSKLLALTSAAFAALAFVMQKLEQFWHKHKSVFTKNIESSNEIELPDKPTTTTMTPTAAK